jgi:hypothetical protein
MGPLRGDFFFFVYCISSTFKLYYSLDKPVPGFFLKRVFHIMHG